MSSLYLQAAARRHLRPACAPTWHPSVSPPIGRDKPGCALGWAGEMRRRPGHAAAAIIHRLIRPAHERPSCLPRLLRKVVLHCVDIPDRAGRRISIIPVAGIVIANTSPHNCIEIPARDVAGVRVAVVRGPAGEISRQVAVHACAHRCKMEIGGKRGGIVYHGPGLPIGYDLGLEVAPGLIATAWTLVVPQACKAAVHAGGIRVALVAAAGGLDPIPVFGSGLRPHDILVDTPFTGGPAKNHVRGASVLSVNSRKCPASGVYVRAISVIPVKAELTGRRPGAVCPSICRDRLSLPWDRGGASGVARQRGIPGNCA